MSEKRRKQQDRPATPQAARPSRGGADFGNRELAQLMDRMVSVTLRDVGGLTNALEAECWASEAVSAWSGRELGDGDAEEVFLPAFVRALERKASSKALAKLAGAECGRQRVAQRARPGSG